MRTGKVCLLVVCAALKVCAASPSEIEDDLKLGRLLQSRGRFAEAQQQFQTALSKANGITERPDLQASALSNLASVEVDRAHFEAAAGLYNRALSVLQNNSGDWTTAIEDLRVQLAELYFLNDETTTAEKLIRGVIAAQEARRSAATPDAAFARDVLACVYAHQKKLSKAEESERQALSMLEVLRRQDKPEYAVATLHLGSFLNIERRPVEALPYLQSALAMLRRLPAPQRPMEASAEITLASVYSFLGRVEEALRSAEDARETAANYYGTNHPATAAILLGEAAVLRTVGQKAAARRAQREGDRILTGNTNERIRSTVPLEALVERH